jgi:hypothetical protein
VLELKQTDSDDDDDDDGGGGGTGKYRAFHNILHDYKHL